MTPAGESRRKLVHVGMLGFAFLLRPLEWWQAALAAGLAVAYNVFLFKRLHGDTMFRSGERERGFAAGLVYYPLAVLALVVVFRHDLAVAGAAWAVLALGDGMATVVGLGLGGAKLPWNRAKSWAGTAAFAVFGAAGALGLGWYLRERVAVAGPLGLGRIVAAAIAAAVLSALLESIDLGIDDNLVVPAVAGSVFWLAIRADASVLASSGFWMQALVGLAVSATTGAVAFRTRSVNGRGFLAGVLIGTLVWAGTAWRGYLVLLAFFVLGTVATKVGYREKAKRGLAEARGGQRSAGSALAKGIVGACASLGVALVPALAPRFALALAAGFATAAADTASSEVGKRFGSTTYSSTRFRRVAAGTEGAISLEGTAAGWLAALAVAAVALAVGLVDGRGMLAVVIAAAIANHLESVAGAVLARSDELANEVLNLLVTLAGAALAWTMAG